VIDTVLMPPAKQASARQILHDAVVKGSAIFNSGHHAACADLYEQTLEQLMVSDLDASTKHHMQRVLSSARHQHRASDRAWTLRRGIDQMFVTLPR
jgi:transforming growth factor-beta-induced protein